MGTSTPFGGPRNNTPLVPDFVNDDTAPPNDNPALHDDDPDKDDADHPPKAPSPKPIPAPPSVPDRFRGARVAFTKFASSDGSDRKALGRAVSRYVSTTAGGSASATRRMGSSRGTAARFASFLGDVANRGIQAALATLNLSGLAGRPAVEILSTLTEAFCPEGGSIDEGIARDAFMETVVDFADAGITDLGSLTPAQLQTMLELYVAHTIEDRIYNDIGVRGVEVPSDVKSAEVVRDQLHDFILGGVTDAFAAAKVDFTAINPATINQTIETLYELSFDMLEALGEYEAQK